MSKETLQLSRVGHEDEIGMILDVDVDTGEITGEDAESVLIDLRNAKKAGFLISMPYPTQYPYTGNFKTDLARILISDGCILPDDWLAAAQLEEAEEEREGVVN